MLDMGLDPDQYDYASPQQTTPSPASPSPAGSSSAGGAFGRGAARGLIPTLGGMGGAALASWALGPEVGLPMSLAAMFAGGLGGAAATGYGQEKAIEHFAPGVAKQLEADAQEHPIASTLGGVASALPVFELSPGQSIRGLSKIPALLRGAGTEAERAAAATAAIQVGMGAGSGVAAPLLEGRAPTAEDIALGAGQGLLFGKPRGWTAKVPGLGGLHPTQETPTEEVPPLADHGPREGTDSERMSAAMGEVARDRRLFDIGRRENAGLTPSLAPERPIPTGIRIGENTAVEPQPGLEPVGTSTGGDRAVGGEEPKVFSAELNDIQRMQREVSDLEVLSKNPALTIAQRILAGQELTDAKARLASAGGLERQRAQATQGQLSVADRNELAAIRLNLTQQPAAPAAVPARDLPLPISANETALPPDTHVGQTPGTGVPAPLTHPDPSVAAELQRISASQAVPSDKKAPVLVTPEPTPTTAAGESGIMGKPSAVATEAEKVPAGKSSTQLTLGPKAAKPFIDFAKSIHAEDVMHKKDEHGKEDYGIETQPHITALYGLTEHDPAPVAAAVANHGPIEVTLGKMSVFDTPDADVLKVDVSGDSLHDLHNKIANLPNEQTYPTYKPHLTIAYLKKGAGKKYAGDARFEGQKLIFDALTHSPPSEIREQTGTTELPLASRQMATVASRPLAELLTDPKNRAVYEMLMDLAAKHNVSVESKSTLTTPEGQLAAGLAEWRKRVATLNVNKLGTDTLAHEVGGHIIFEDMLLSNDPAVRSLAERGLLLMGSRERMAQALGTRMTDLAGMRVEGLTLKRFTTWMKDFVSYIKTKWGNANETDFANLLARRILSDGPYDPMPGVTANTPELQYQRVVTTDAATRAEVEAQLRKADEVKDWTLPGVRSIVDSVKARVGQAAGKALAGAEQLGQTFAGSFRHPFVSGLKSLTAAERANVDRYVYSVKAGEGTVDPSLPTLSPKEQNFVENVLRPHMQTIADTVEATGKRIDEDGALRTIKRNPWWVPDVPRQDVLWLVSQKSNTPKAQALLSDMYQHMQDKLGLPSLEAARDMYANKKIQQAMLAGGGSTEYGPISRPAGIGLPDSWRAPLDEALPRYSDRAGKALGFFKAFNENPEASYQLGIEGQDGTAPDRPPNYTGGTFTEDTAVKQALKVLKGDYEAVDQNINIVNRTAKTLSLQTLTGLADALTAWTQILPDMRPKDLPILLKMWSDIPRGIQNAVRMGRAKDQSIALGELGTEGTHYAGLSKVVQGFHKLADGINAVTGRNALELFSRGATMNAGEMLAWSKLGDAFSPAASKADRRSAVLFFREHAPEGWERTLGDAVQNRTVHDSPEVARIMDEAAAHVVDNAQGTYGIRGLPGVALTGHLAPFLSLAKWNIEKFNTFNRTVVGAARRGNLTPLLTTAFGAIGGGTMVELMREWLTRRKPSDASWSEIIDAGGTGLPYKMAALAGWSGYGGIATEIGKQITDLATGRPPQGFRFPAISFVSNVSERLGQASVAVNNGENPFDVAMQLAAQLTKDNVQVARAGLAWTEQGGADVKRANTLRDVNVFNRESGQPIKAIGSAIDTNPFLNADQRAFGRSEDIGTIMKMAPALVNEAFQRGGGDINRVKQLLNSARNSGSDLLPSMEAQPQRFMQFINFIRRSQGDEAANAAMQDYARKQGLDAVRRDLIPRL